MTDSEVKMIVDGLKEGMPKPDTSASKMADTAFKFVSTVSLALVYWVLTTVNAMQKDIVQLSADAQYMKVALDKLEDFTAKPIFTKEDFESARSSSLTKISENRNAIIAIEKRLNQFDLKMQRIENAIDKK